VKLSEITARTVTRTIDVLGEPVEVRLRPAAHTSAFDDRTTTAMRANDAKALADCLAELIAFIDIVDDDGRPIPCTGESFYRLLPLTVMASLWERVGEVSRPGEPKGATSAAG